MSVYENGELVLYGFVGENLWDAGFTAREVLSALAEHGSQNDLKVRLNSGGGYVDDGRSIYNALKVHEGQVTVFVDGVAASSASLIAMAGDKIVMRSGALMMIHDPATVTVGTAEDHDISKQALERMAESFAETYSARSGQSPEDVRAAMKATTWMTAEEAVEAGYADEADEETARMAAAFDYRSYAAAPDDLTKLSKKNGWSFKAAGMAESAATTSQKEKDMADKTPADGKSADTAEAVSAAVAEATARIQKILGSDEAKGQEGLAQFFAYKTELTAEAAIEALGAAHKEPETAGGDEGGSNAPAYEAGRLQASGQAQPGAQHKPATATLDRGGIFAARRGQATGA
ncbi:Clp protease ClpP [Labrenzia sp. R4_1]|uniref:head maturation protease, ClpP-related n=1 Tax=Labrenzia sp. R4_1 TaxID=2821106 RepID=UPI001ADA182D|nr:head maturation protease, ClpP-related [Labrenzia sp. R4_1]MBO9424682.1 Clp protease ClpP [Labrenzia sp. R4_1]